MDYANRMRDSLLIMNTFKPAIKSANLDTMLLHMNINDDKNQIPQRDRHIKQVMHANPIPAFYDQPCSQEIDRLLYYYPNMMFEPSNQSNSCPIVDGSCAARNELATNEVHEYKRGPSPCNYRDPSLIILSFAIFFAKSQQYPLRNNLLSASTETSVSKGDDWSSSIGLRLCHGIAKDRELLLYPLWISLNHQLQLQSLREMCSRLRLPLMLNDDKTSHVSTCGLSRRFQS
jgi:hypothetical protein